MAGRTAVDAYRTAHAQLHNKPYYRGVHDDHTPLLEQMLKGLSKQGFISDKPILIEMSSEILAKFFDASEDLSVQELGFKDKADFDAKVTEADLEALELKWR